MNLKEIYKPIEKEFNQVDRILKKSLSGAGDDFIDDIGNFLIESPGKRIRPALVILSAKALASDTVPDLGKKITEIAAAMELVHTASLIHDDVMDHSDLRRNKPTVNSKWGDDVSIAFGDYLYSVAFEIIADSATSDIIHCFSAATKAMCEGEFFQISHRGDMDLLKERYMTIVKKKTASLFVASCHSGALASNCKKSLQENLKQYGMNFGIAFQIVDDYQDLMAEERNLGKKPGQDIGIGEVTLPVLNLLEAVPSPTREEIKSLIVSKRGGECLTRIRKEILKTDASERTKKDALSFSIMAKKSVDELGASPYKDSLINLADFVIYRGFEGV